MIEYGELSSPPSYNFNSLFVKLPLTPTSVSRLRSIPVRNSKPLGLQVERIRTKITPQNTNFKCSSDKTHPISTLPPTQKTYYSRVLRQRIESKKYVEAINLYFEMKLLGFEPGVRLETVLIDQLMKSGRTHDAFRVFEEMGDRNVITWTSVISGCVRNNHHELGFSLFVQMLNSGVFPNDFTLNVAFQACGELPYVEVGKQVHSFTIKTGLVHNCRIQNCLIHYYSTIGLLGSAYRVFSRMPEPDFVSFTSMVAGFSKNNLVESAFEVFDEMLWLGIDPNEHTVTSILTGCGTGPGEQIHAYMVKTSLDRSPYSASALINFYSKQCFIEKAELIFEQLDDKNVITWSLMISCYQHNGLVNKALNSFSKMIVSGIEPNEFTFAIAIGACGLCTVPECLGRQLHGYVIKLKLGSEERIFNALLTMYARMGMIEELAKVFEKIQDPDIISWSAAISGYSQNGFSEKSASLLCLMHQKGVNPNEYGLSSALSSCSNLALLDQGRQFHGLALKLGCDLDVCVGNALVNMYAKCGNIDDALSAFDGMYVHDIMSWNTLIHGYAQHGHGKKALQAFDEMLEMGSIKPNHATFVGVLSACSHVGYVNKALQYFKIMDSQYGVAPSMSHHACMVDLMGRAGRLDEAAQIINGMPFEPDSSIWKALAGSCRVHKNLELGKFAAKRAIELSPDDSANYVLLSNLQAVCGEWEDAKSTRKVMETRGLKKDVGLSWIEIKSEVHTFLARDKNHSRTREIYKILKELLKQMREEGYSPEVCCLIHE